MSITNMSITTSWLYILSISYMKLHPSYGRGWKISLKCRQSKGNNFYITDDTLMKLHMQNHTMVIYIHYSTNPLQRYGRRWEKTSLKFRQSKGNNFSITNDTLMKLPMHNHYGHIYSVKVAEDRKKNLN